MHRQGVCLARRAPTASQFRLPSPFLTRPASSSVSSPGSQKRPPLLGRHRTVPVDLFRINASEKVILRDYTAQKKLKRTSYDLHIHEDGLVYPKDGPNFEGPNGASVRPNGAFLQEVVRGFRGKNTTIWRIPAGTDLPPDLVLLHEHTDHHSIQCTRPMTLSELNKTITAFVQKHGERMTKDEFCEKYPFTV
ncbi:uncharacterized protein EV422DRAFT_496888 [Fimicolochytrium jonesii]|uniref:uncharacterized protein n=1 Tax=Fimicolochytrium jonesii TaxID=1396493 RepID=UPI0022FF0B56|nr:uncharacterized protein EV422DRAFT_496888 [Fimicolochytrium jonesii]KAI8820478.1 hypothetical protein EV422DRAFT_496888 [Fimicolochytrium jonesii]